MDIDTREFTVTAGGTGQPQRAAMGVVIAGFCAMSGQGKCACPHLGEVTGATQNAKVICVAVVPAHTDVVGTQGQRIAALQPAEVVGIGARHGERDLLRVVGSSVQGAVLQCVHVAKRQSTASRDDRCGAEMGIGVGQRQCPATVFKQTARIACPACDEAAQGARVVDGDL